MLFLCLLLCWDLRVGNHAEGEENVFFFSSKLGDCCGKRPILSFIEKFGHGGLAALVS